MNEMKEAKAKSKRKINCYIQNAVFDIDKKKIEENLYSFFERKTSALINISGKKQKTDEIN